MPREETPAQSTAGLDNTEEEDFTILVHKVLEGVRGDAYLSYLPCSTGYGPGEVVG